jgi:hypothetical protein
LGEKGAQLLSAAPAPARDNSPANPVNISQINPNPVRQASLTEAKE